jgi:alpha-ketoglutarate-dependent taurine dioxygenase/4-hydroxybenzoate polyprenyltransferase
MNAIVAIEPLHPFGVVVQVQRGASLSAIALGELRALVDRHRVVLLRGLATMSKSALVEQARRFGRLQAWPFGAVHDVRPKTSPNNYLYSRRAVPLHWDGAFAGRAPHLLVFQCLASGEGGAGETVFVDTSRVIAAADQATRDRWHALSYVYETERVAHYGGRFSAPVSAVHPHTHEPILRFAEPVDDVNPVRVRAEGLDPIASAATITELRAALASPDATLEIAWRAGDVLLADNHALLHGRRALAGGDDRHLQRVNVLDDARASWREVVRDAIRIRRPEFMVAEIPIFLIAALSVASPSLAPWRVAEVAALFMLLFHVGDMANCLADRDLDAVYKTHLAEAVRSLGPRRVATQIGLSGAAAMGLAAHLAWSTGRIEIAGLVAIGLFLGHQYSFAPLRFKSRGLWQVPALALLIFVGPMLLVARALSDAMPPLGLVLAYAAMQQGTIAINTAEDLPEDVEAGVRTSAVALGLRGIVALSFAMISLGGLGVLASLLGPAWAVGRPWALAPLAFAWLWVVRDVGRLLLRVRAAETEVALACVRAAARRMPAWITATAWGTLVAVAASRGGFAW